MSRALSIFHGPFGRASIYDLDRPMTTHAHREGHLIFHLGGLPGVVPVNATRYVCDAGNAVAVNPWEPHAFQQFIPGSNGTYLVLYINPSWYSRTIRSDQPEGLFFPSPRVPVSAAMATLIDDIRRMMDRNRTTPMFEQAIIDLSYESSMGTARVLGGNSHDGRQAFSSVDFRVRKSIELLSHLPQSDDPPELQRDRMGGIARAAGISRAHFFKLFRDHTGLTPKLYSNTIQIERSLTLLAETNDPVTHIGEDLGFSCQSTFTRFFTSHVGMAPSAYRSVVRVVGQTVAPEKTMLAAAGMTV
jgi:AraC-like DNA-binding protein